MSVIDVQNAKQIRDPMTVLVKMEVPEDVDVSFSNFVYVKLKDEELEERSWPMRALADLQGDGFALDGSRALYDPTVTASATNGKLGVRGDIGADLQFKVTGDSTINGLSIAATGADSVVFNGHTAYFSDGQVIIPVGASSITLEFPAAETDERVEVSLTMPGTSLQVTNDSIISCIVSLRSDLAIDNPTLPESEINIEVYNDVDISEVVASIPDDSPLTYSAGYMGDMSPERQFYISGQVTWVDNVLSIHAVDAVHFLDKETGPRLFGSESPTAEQSILQLVAGIVNLLEQGGVTPKQDHLRYINAAKTTTEKWHCINRGNIRDIIAFINNVFKIDNLNASVFYYNYPASVPKAFWLTYIDAGIPTLSSIKPSVKWSVDESDCGEIKKNIETPVGRIDLKHTEAPDLHGKCGTVTWNKNGEAYPQFDYLTNFFDTQVDDPALNPNPILLPFSSTGSGLVDPDYTPSTVPARSLGSGVVFRIGIYPLMDSETPQNVKNKDYFHGGTIYSQVIPANAPRRYNITYRTVAEAWKWLLQKGYVNSDDTTYDLIISGHFAGTYNEEKTYVGQQEGSTLEMDGLLYGKWYFCNGVTNQVAYPDMAMQSLLDRSNITGSFIWKGDPRMQPRDVVEFHRLDGTVEEITLENITIHHEGGGTYAEITYRKGIC